MMVQVKTLGLPPRSRGSHVAHAALKAPMACSRAGSRPAGGEFQTAMP
jgi:hypothetical protein